MKKSVLLIALLVPALGWSQGKVGLLDPMAALESSERVQQQLSQLDQQMEAEGRKLRQLEQEIGALQQRLEREGMTLSEEEVNRLRGEGQQKLMQYQQQERSLQQQYGGAQRALLEEMQPKLQQAVEKVAKQKKLDVVVNAQAVLYAVDGLDITDAVGTELNKLK